MAAITSSNNLPVRPQPAEESNRLTRAYARLPDLGIEVHREGETAALETIMPRAVSYSMSRERMPISVMGSMDPAMFTRSQPRITGSLVFATRYQWHGVPGVNDHWDIHLHGRNDAGGPTSMSLLGVVVTDISYDSTEQTYTADFVCREVSGWHSNIGGGNQIDLMTMMEAARNVIDQYGTPNTMILNPQAYEALMKIYAPAMEKKVEEPPKVRRSTLREIVD